MDWEKIEDFRKEKSKIHLEILLFVFSNEKKIWRFFGRAQPIFSKNKKFFPKTLPLFSLEYVWLFKGVFSFDYVC